MTSLDTTLTYSKWSRSPTRAHSETCLNPTKTFSKTVSRAAQPNLHRGRISAHACKSRRAPRPRKQDGKLNRHGLGARRVALLAPRGELSKYRHPLGYVGAITKIFCKVQKLVPHFGRRELNSEWGRSAEGEEGVCHSHVRGRQPVSFPEHDAHSERAPPRRTAYSERPPVRRRGFDKAGRQIARFTERRHDCRPAP